MRRCHALTIIAILLSGLLNAQPLEPKVVKRAAQQIDRYLTSDYREAQVMPEARVDDGTFVRRAYLTIVGRIPSAEEAKAFIEDQSMTKRADLVDHLLASPGYESHLFNWLGDLLRVQTRTGREKHGLAWHVWLRRSIAEDKPWDNLVMEMLNANGHAVNNPAVGYYLRDRNMHLDNFSNTMQVFLGQQMGCAQCHDHPFEDWGQYEYYQMAAFGGGIEYRSEDMRELVRRVAQENHKAQKDGQTEADHGKLSRADMRRERQGMIRQAGRQLRPFFQVINRDAITDNSMRQLRLPEDYQYSDAKPSQVIEPETVFGPKLEDVAPDKRKEAFARWVTSPENPYFTRTIVNRTWKRTFGAPLYDSLNDLKEGSKTAHPKLAEALENYMKLCNYDLRQFQRILFHTKLFELECMAREPVAGEPVFFHGMVLRRMSAEQLYDSFLVLRRGEIDNGINQEMVQNWQSHVSMVNAVFDAPAEELLTLAEAAQQGQDQLRSAQSQMRQARLQLEKAESRQQKIEAQVAVRRARERLNQARAQANPLMSMSMAMMSGAVGAGKNKGMLRASELPAPFHPAHIVRQFGGSDRETPSSGHTLAAVPQALTLLNSWQTDPTHPTQRIGNRAHHLSSMLQNLKTSSDKLEYLFLSIYGTVPNPAESSRYVSMMADQQALNNLATAMVNSKRFIFIR